MDMRAGSNNGDVVVNLKRAEALVLFEWLSVRRDDKSDLPWEHQSEQRVMWDLLASLEKLLHEPFAAGYRALLAKAREEVAD